MNIKEAIIKLLRNYSIEELKCDNWKIKRDYIREVNIYYLDKIIAIYCENDITSGILRINSDYPKIAKNELEEIIKALEEEKILSFVAYKKL